MSNYGWKLEMSDLCSFSQTHRRCISLFFLSTLKEQNYIICTCVLHLASYSGGRGRRSVKMMLSIHWKKLISRGTLSIPQCLVVFMQVIEKLPTYTTLVRRKWVWGGKYHKKETMYTLVPTTSCVVYPDM